MKLIITDNHWIQYSQKSYLVSQRSITFINSQANKILFGKLVIRQQLHLKCTILRVNNFTVSIFLMKMSTFYTSYILVVYHSVCFLCVPHPSCRDRRPVHDKAFLLLLDQSQEHCTHATHKHCMCDLWVGNKPILRWGNGNSEGPGYLSDFTHRHRLSDGY